MTDATTARRQQRRRAKLDEAARAAGWHSWAKFETSIIKGEATMEGNYFEWEGPGWYATGDFGGYTRTVYFGNEECPDTTGTGYGTPVWYDSKP